jgi:hypothetical protein
LITRTPIPLTGLSAIRVGLQFLRDPIAAMRRNYEECGPFNVVSNTPPFVKNPKLTMFGLPLILTAGREFNDEVLSHPETWRPVSIFPGGLEILPQGG